MKFHGKIEIIGIGQAIPNQVRGDKRKISFPINHEPSDEWKSLFLRNPLGGPANPPTDEFEFSVTTVSFWCRTDQIQKYHSMLERYMERANQIYLKAVEEQVDLQKQRIEYQKKEAERQKKDLEESNEILRKLKPKN